MKILFTVLLLFLINHFSYSQVSVVEAFPNLTFSRPIDLQHPPDSTNRLFIVEQRGNIYVIENDSTTLQKKLFFSLKDSVDTGNEQGLLGMAFHPGYKNNGYFYVSYNPAGPDSSIIARYEVSANPDVADQGKKKIILGVKQPAANHNGGQIGFGPDDHYLYIGFGDGGGAGNQYHNAQNLHTLLGAMLRINVDDTSSYGNYAIPPDNPFFGNDSSYREEIYAYGLRNPWRWSFDPVTKWLWCGDVGQAHWEEVDIIIKGGNYGWNIMEGTHCYSPSSGCDDTGLIYPIAEYNHSQGVAISGGYVYRGKKVPDLYGKYVYGDNGSGVIWTIDYDSSSAPVNEILMDSDISISAFGVDQNKELYICGLYSGKIYKFYQPPVVLNLDAPLLITPENNMDSVRTDTVLFKWHKVDNAEIYLLEIASENTFAPEYYSTSTADTFADVPLNASTGVDFFWHVKAAAGADTSEWSEPWKFTTEPPVTNLNSPDKKPLSFQLTQNYPNPFNNSTMISYQLSTKSRVALKIYNIAGKEIKTLVNGVQNPGEYSVSFDATNLSSGIYFYRLSTSTSYTQSRKMILIK